jgi:hypothetical protein
MQYLLLFYFNNGDTKAPQSSVVRKLPLLDMTPYGFSHSKPSFWTKFKSHFHGRKRVWYDEEGGNWLLRSKGIYLVTWTSYLRRLWIILDRAGLDGPL